MRTCLNCYGDAEGHKQTRACECKYTVEIYYNNALYSSKVLSLNDYFDADSYSIPVKERPADKIAGYKTVLIPDENNPVKEDGAVKAKRPIPSPLGSRQSKFLPPAAIFFTGRTNTAT